MRPVWRGVAGLAVLSGLLLAPESASAGDGGKGEPAAAAASPRGVVLHVIGGHDDAALEDTIRELLARLNLALLSEGTASPPDAVVGRVEIDLSRAADAVLVVTDGRTGDVRLRRTIPRDTSQAIVREEIAHTVQSAVEAQLLAEKDPSAPPAPAPPPPPPPAAPAIAPVLPAPPVVREQPRAASAPSVFGLDLTTLGGVGPIANGSGPSARIGAGVVGMAHAPVRLSLALTFLYALPFDTGTPEISSHTSIASVRAIPSIEILHTRWLALDLGAGAGLDMITVAPRSDSLPASNLGPQTSRGDWLLTASASAHVAIASGVVFLLSVAADVDLASRQYVLAQGASDSEVLAPWRVRPMVLAGFGFTALGDGHFTTATPGGGR